MSCFQTLKTRGFVHQWTEHKDFPHRLDRDSVVFYAGFDATADSFHIGNLVILMMVRWLVSFGHRPIIIIGGGTTQVGDPSGRTEMRPFFSDTQQLNHNIQSLEGFIRRFLPKSTTIHFVNNQDWLESLTCLSFLRDVGRHFSVNRMVSLDTVRQRLDAQAPLSFLELSYILLQSYDYWHLYKNYDCTLQIGGADQWANILGGVDLVRRRESQTVDGITCPLITTNSGQKMGKTHQGALWLEAHKLSPYAYWQFWRNVDDQDVGRFLRLYTLLSENEIHELESLQGEEINAAKIRLAQEATFLIHGLRDPEDGHATWTVSAQETVSVVQALQALKFTTSLSQGRRLIQQGGVWLDSHQVTDPWMMLPSTADSCTLKVGKTKKGQVIFFQSSV